MVFFNYALRKLNAKIVYYGPGLCGKTTNLQWIHDHFEGGQRGKMISLSTEGDRTIFFDLLPLEIGTIRGMDVTLQLYTVPGQVHYNSTRQLVLRGADGVVFVADSQSTMRTSNVESLGNLEENLSLQGVELASFPHVLQFNKRDLGDLISVEDLDADLNQHSVPFFEAIATEGVGVQETLEGIVKLVMRSLRERYEPVAAAGVTGPGIGPVPLDVEVPVAPRRPPTVPPPVRPQVPPIESPRPPLAPPMPATRARLGSEEGGLQDDVPTRVYSEGHPPQQEERGGLIGGGFWSVAAERRGADASSAGDDDADSGFAMPFADMETTTDVSRHDELMPSSPIESLSDRVEDDAEDEFESRGIEVAAEIAAPFEVADLTPEPFTAASVFGAPDAPGEAGDDAVQGEMPGVGDAVDAGEAPIVGDLDSAAETPSAGDLDAAATPATDASSAARPEEPEEEPTPPERPASWPARLRGTVDDLVASVLGPRHGRGAEEATATRAAAADSEREVDVELELSSPEMPPPETEAGLEPEPDVSARAWWEAPLDEPPAAAEIGFAEEPDEEPVVVEPGGLDDAVSELAGHAAGFEEATEDAVVRESSGPGGPIGEGLADALEPDEPAQDAVLDLDAEVASAASGEEQEIAAEERLVADESEPASLAAADEDVDQLFDEPTADAGVVDTAGPEQTPNEVGYEAEAFVPDDHVDVEPPPLRDRDWEEAHTGEVLTAEERREKAEAAQLSGSPAGLGTAADAEPVTAAAVAEAAHEPFSRRGPITLGDGDPFGDVVDDEPTPVRQEVRPQVVVSAPAVDSLVSPGDGLIRAGDNQLHLRLHGTGAIAESGQVRALDIEVPVPGSWVGNRRVTLQLRLTLSPVPEDDDGGPGGAP